MGKKRLSLNRSGGAKNYNNPLKGGPYSAHPVHYNMIENIHLDLDAMDNEIDKALNSTSTKVRQVAHNFTVLQSIYFNTDTRKWVLAQADDKDTIGTHIIVEVIDKDYFVAGLSGIFEIRNTLDLGYWFTSDTVAGELVDTAPDINNPMIQVIDSNSIRVLDIGIVDNLDSIPTNNVTVTNLVTPDYTAPEVGDTMQDITNKVAGLQLQSGGKVNALGSITGVNEINLSNGTFVTATLTGAIELSFTGLPTAGFVKDFVLLFTNIETITFPVGTMFAGGAPPVVIASPYMFVCSVDSSGVVTVYSLIDNIIVPV